MVCKQGNDTRQRLAEEQGLHGVTGCQGQQQPSVWRAGQTLRATREGEDRLKWQPPFPSLSEPGLCRQSSLQAWLQPYASLLGERGTISGEAWSSRIWESWAVSPAFGGKERSCRGKATPQRALARVRRTETPRPGCAGCVQELGARAGAHGLGHCSLGARAACRSWGIQTRALQPGFTAWVQGLGREDQGRSL